MVQGLGENWLDVGGIRTRYLDGGAGDTIVFLHGGYAGCGYAADAADSWAQAMAACAAKFRTIAPDRLGQGGTANPEDDAGYAMAASVHHAHQFLKALGAGPYHLVGHDSGGFVALQIALADPLMVRSCTVVASHTAAPGPGRDEFALACNPYPPLAPESQRFVAGQMWHGEPDRGWVERGARLLQSPAHRTAWQRMGQAGLLDVLYTPYLRIDRESAHARLQQDGIGRPTLLIWGFDDPIAPLVQGYALYDLLARHELRCEMHVINKAGHYPFLEVPGECHRALSNFLEDVRHGV